MGFAFLPEYRAQGYAYESAAAVLAYGQKCVRPQADCGDHLA